MKKKLFADEHSAVRTRYKAYCESDNFKGDWRDDLNEAVADGRKHREENSDELHDIHIISEERINRRML